MFNLLKKPVLLAGSVHFRGNLPPRAEEFEYMRGHGCDIQRAQVRENAHWELKLKHPRWGDATLTAMKQMPLPTRLLEWSVSLTEKEKEEAAAAGTGVSIGIESSRKDAMRDRKHLFHYLSAIIGDDGVVASDHVSTRFWSRGALRDEVMHDADADISQLYELHAVSQDRPSEKRGEGEEEEEPPVAWLHTHGLAEIGAFDFDILAPEMSLVPHGVPRALAFAAAEGDLSPNTARYQIMRGLPDIRCVPADEFMRTAGEPWTSMRQHDEYHSKDRAVLCDTTTLFSRLLRKGARPSTAMRTPAQDGMLVSYSSLATQVMSARAAASLPVFRALREELAKFNLPSLVKLGYKVDHASADSDREHLWFEVHDVTDAGIDATLLNAPYDVARLKQGDRGIHPAELLTEWAIMTPFGQVNPHDTKLARRIRENPEGFAEMLQLAAMFERAGGEGG